MAHTNTETIRLSRQCQAILDRLRHGPATNRELSALCLKYTSRISDLRKSGYDVQVVRHDRATGQTWYQWRRETVATQERLW